jgi:predicted ArsR family transcriptional regulator
VVKDHREICDMEQRMMSRLLDADVHLGSCMLEGHTACQFSVRPRLEERAEDAPVPEAETVHD